MNNAFFEHEFDELEEELDEDEDFEYGPSVEDFVSENTANYEDLDLDTEDYDQKFEDYDSPDVEDL